MKRLAIVAHLTVLALLPASAHAQTFYTCGEGTVQKVQTLTSTRAANEGSRTLDGDTLWIDGTQGQQETYEVMVRLNGVLYTGRSWSDELWNFDPAYLSVGQHISVCANGAQIVLDRHDGTDYRAKVVRIEPDLSSSDDSWLQSAVVY